MVSLSYNSFRVNLNKNTDTYNTVESKKFESGWFEFLDISKSFNFTEYFSNSALLKNIGCSNFERRIGLIRSDFGVIFFYSDTVRALFQAYKTKYM